MITAVLFVFGLIFGSFVNALVWRLHEQSKLGTKKNSAARKFRKELSISKGRSMCPQCHHELAAVDLVPIISWLWLHGKCRYCHKPIPDNPLVELLTGVVFAVSCFYWPHGFHGPGLFQFICWLAFLVGFVALAIYDLRWFLLPDRIVFPLIGLAVVQTIVLAVWHQSFADLWQPTAGALVIFGLFWTLFQVSGGSWIGGGDVKLAIVLGILAGMPFRALTVIFLASLAGTLFSIPELIKGKQGLTRRIPFGPSLLLATFVIVLYGDSISRWYLGLVLR